MSGGGTWMGRLWLAGLGLFLAAAGMGMMAYLWMSFQKARVMDGWEERRCEVRESRAEETGLSRHGVARYRAVVRYGFELGGVEYESGRVKRLEIAGSLKKVEKWVERFPAGMETVCYVDPGDPVMAVLVKDSKAAIYSIWFPMIFVVGGLGIAVGGLRKRKAVS